MANSGLAAAGTATTPAQAVSGLATALLQMITTREGGLAGLIQNFYEKGLGEIASSWVSNEKNLPIAADQVTRVLGPEVIRELAAKSGTAPESAAGQIAQLHPEIVNQLTPEGKVPEGNLMERVVHRVKVRLAHIAERLEGLR